MAADPDAAMSPAECLRAEGFTIRAWGGGLHIFENGTMNGLLDLRHGIEVIALHNEERGNGQFVAVMGTFERLAAAHGAKMQVVQIWNNRLAKWLKRRGYVLAKHPELGRFATLRIKDIQHA